MSNSRISKKERNLIKGAIRRVFSRSELRQEVIKRCIDKDHIDLTRPRVKTWCKCELCGTYIAKSSMVVDHISPVIPLDSSMEEMTWEQMIDRLWCDISNLQGICEQEHALKTKLENKLRRENKRAKLKSRSNK